MIQFDAHKKHREKCYSPLKTHYHTDGMQTVRQTPDGRLLSMNPSETIMNDFGLTAAFWMVDSASRCVVLRIHQQ